MTRMTDPTHDTSRYVTLDEAVTMVEELVGQACYSEDGRLFDHGCLSTYEDACDFLVKARPERWKLVPRGVELIGEW